MTEDEAYDLLVFYQTHTYEARRKDLDSPFVKSLKEKELSKGSIAYDRWAARFFAKAFFNRGHTEMEPFSYQ